MSVLSNPFTTETTNLPPSLIVDRNDFLDRLVDTVTIRRENSLVIGEYGIGKTCLLRKLRDTVAARSGGTVLQVPMDMVSLSDSAADFLVAVLQKLCEETWVTVFGRKYSELLLGLDGKRKVQQTMFRHLDTFMNLFRLLRPEQTTYTKEQASHIGGNLAIKAGASEKSSATINAGSLRPFEFIRLASELTEILETKGIEQTVVFGDEANHISPNMEVELFRRNFEAFSEKNIQFVFAATRRAIDSVPEMRDAFPVIIELEGFDNPNQLDEMLEIYETHAMRLPEFTASARSRIWTTTMGHPREIQRICKRCVEIASEQTAEIVDDSLVFDACLDLYNVTASLRLQQRQK